MFSKKERFAVKYLLFFSQKDKVKIVSTIITKEKFYPLQAFKIFLLFKCKNR